MLKHLHGGHKATALALVVAGWVAFLGGVVVHDSYPVVSTCLMAVARVLP